ncbi:MAG TPA: COX15/CtaA family protein [Caulobacteraceae bacterium]|jgi:cytochrome c oxidase assembly protein subunit 15|nr:COX15/CtaA family protein [Caulobacteraceae bacterium]
MRHFHPEQRSRAVAVWLFVLAAMVLAMVVVGGATRLTHSGLSITQWKPIRGVIPPLNPSEWAQEFQRYRQIPQYRLLNQGMSLHEFKGIYWWEWTHRLLGRLIGVVFLIPFVWFFLTGKLNRKLIVRCVILFFLGALQGLIGWWMVASGLEVRTSVAPERLAIHLGAALILFVALIWTGLEAQAVERESRPPGSWTIIAGVLLVLAYLQSLMGALVAGNQAGLVYNDWPLMNGKLIAPVDWKGGALHAFLHDQSLVQFDHRIGAYLLLMAVTGYGVVIVGARAPGALKLAAVILAGLVWLQAALGIATLMNAAPLPLALIHQLGAALVLAAATFNLWRVRRLNERAFAGGIGAQSL